MLSNVILFDGKDSGPKRKKERKIRAVTKIRLYVQIILATISARFGGGIAVE